MTVSEIIDRVRANLYDLGMVRWTASNILDSIQDGYDDLAVMTQCIEKIATVNFVGNLSYYKMTDYITDYFRVFAIWNNDTKKWMEPISLTELNAFNYRWELENGVPAFFSPIGYEYVAFYKKPATTTGSMLVFYSAQADTLTPASTPNVPVGTENALEDYATGDMFDQDLEYTKADQYFTDYMDKQKDVIRDLNRRSLPDRIRSLAFAVGNIQKR